MTVFPPMRGTSYLLPQVESTAIDPGLFPAGLEKGGGLPYCRPSLGIQTGELQMIRSLKPAFAAAVLCVVLAVPPVQAGGVASGIRLDVPENTFRFSPVPEGTEILHDFILKNRGVEPAAILNVRTG
jgi:hypothetical protein